MRKAARQILSLILCVCLAGSMIPWAFAAEATGGFTLSYQFDKASYETGDEIKATVVLTRDSTEEYRLRGFTIDVRFPNLNLDYVEKPIADCGAVSNSVIITPTVDRSTTDVRLSLMHMSEDTFDRCGQVTNIATLTFQAKAAGNISLVTVPVPTEILTVDGTYKPEHPQGEISIMTPGTSETEYTVSFARGGADSGADPAAIADQKENSQFAIPACGYTWEHHRFLGWLDNTGDTRLWQAGNVYTMPTQNVTFTAQWEQYAYQAVFVGGEGTTGEPPAARWYEPGEGRLLPTENTLKKSGYTFEGWQYHGVTYKTTFPMPSQDVTLTAVWKQNDTSGGGGSGGTIVKPQDPVTDCPRNTTCPIDPFYDTKNDFWWHDGVHYCLDKGLMVGVGDQLFAPNGTTSRAMIVSILWRMEGKPVVNYAMTFEDVADGQWYTEAIRWAQSTGVVEGYSDAVFGWNDPITREQLAAILCRYASRKGVDISSKGDLTRFTDAGEISSWAVESMRWAVSAGLISGRTASTIVPLAHATRAEAATMIYHFCGKVLSK